MSRLQPGSPPRTTLKNVRRRLIIGERGVSGLLVLRFWEFFVFLLHCARLFPLHTFRVSSDPVPPFLLTSPRFRSRKLRERRVTLTEACPYRSSSRGNCSALDDFLTAPPSGNAFRRCVIAARSLWISLVCEVVPRALLAELELARVLLGASGGGQFLLVPAGCRSRPRRRLPAHSAAQISTRNPQPGSPALGRY